MESERRIYVNRQLPDTRQAAGIRSLLPQHIFQDEWVYNAADIDRRPRGLGPRPGEAEDEKTAQLLSRPRRLLLEPTSVRPD